MFPQTAPINDRHRRISNSQRVRVPLHEYRFAEHEHDEQPESSIAYEGLDRSSLICARVNSSA